MQVRTMEFLRVDFSQPIQMVSLSVSAAEVSRCTCSGEDDAAAAAGRDAQAALGTGSQSFTRFGG